MFNVASVFQILCIRVVVHVFRVYYFKSQSEDWMISDSGEINQSVDSMVQPTVMDRLVLESGTNLSQIKANWWAPDWITHHL